MKKLLQIFSVLSVLALLSACSLDGGKDSGPEAPDVMDASELPATGGTQPASATEALEIFNGALVAFSVAMDDETTMASMKSRSGARATYTDGGDINWTGSYGGGTVNMTGSYSSRVTYPDALENETAAPNTWYSIAADYGVNLSGTIDSIEVEDDYDYLVTYTISGELIENMDASMDVDVMFDSYGDLSDIRGEMSADLEYGVAFSVLRNSDNKGAKFVITFAASASQDLGEAGTAITAGTLTVYNDANQVIYTIDVDVDDLDGLDIPDIGDLM